MAGTLQKLATSRWTSLRDSDGRDSVRAAVTVACKWVLSAASVTLESPHFFNELRVFS